MNRVRKGLRRDFSRVSLPLRARWLLCCLLILACASVGFTQRSAEADRLLGEARAAAASARETYAGSIFNIDQPLWRSALDLGRQALQEAPNDPDITRFLAQTYGEISWYVRAWAQWQDYLTLGGTLDGDTAAQFAEAGTELGFARYEVGDLAGALPFYEAVNATLPNNIEALSWLARIHFELGEAEQALPYWQRLTELEPDNSGFAYYLNLTEEQIQIGPEASGAFQRGLQAYDAGSLEAALDAFETSLSANNSFIQAYVWAARTSQELGMPSKAVGYWEQVLELDPSDSRADYFAQVARDQQEWGVEAVNAYVEGRRLYEQDDLAGAAERFDDAALANPRYKEALVWVARSYQELGRVNRAIAAWQRVLELDPDDNRARYFLRQAEQQRTYGDEAGRAFAQGVSAFELADFGEAITHFEEAVDANPDFTEAWGWLGRTYFSQGNYTEAADAYSRAADLEPDNDDYRFFADEAAALAEE